MNNFSGPWHRSTALVVWYLVLGSFGQVDGGRELGSALMEVLGSGWAACCVQNWVARGGQAFRVRRSQRSEHQRTWLLECGQERQKQGYCWQVLATSLFGQVGPRSVPSYRWYKHLPPRSLIVIVKSQFKLPKNCYSYNHHSESRLEFSDK